MSLISDRVAGYKGRSSYVHMAIFKGGGGLRVRNYEEKFFICPSVSLFNIFVQWSFNVDQFTCELFTVT